MSDHPPIAPPDMLIWSATRVWDEVSEGLDPLIAMKLGGVVRNLISISYGMGIADGRRGLAAEPCAACPAKGGNSNG